MTLEKFKKGSQQMDKNKYQKPIKRTAMTRIDEKTHRKLSAYKALSPDCKTLSQAIDKLMEGNKIEPYKLTIKDKNELC